MVNRLKEEGYYVIGVDLHHPNYEDSAADRFILHDLRQQDLLYSVFTDQRAGVHLDFDEVYQFAADMGGAGFVFTGENDYDILNNSALCNLNVLAKCERVGKIFFSSSACIYPQEIQTDPANPGLRETDAYPADPDSDYGFEKLFSERLYRAFAQNNPDVSVRIGRFHNIYGPLGTWYGGREKAPAAVCRKIAAAEDGETIEIWGDGEQTRSFLYISECIEAVRRLMFSSCEQPINIGSDEMVTINQMVDMVSLIANKTVNVEHIPGPLGVRGRNSDNTMIAEVLGWAPEYPLMDGLRHTYKWIEEQLSLT